MIIKIKNKILIYYIKAFTCKYNKAINIFMVNFTVKKMGANIFEKPSNVP